MALFRYEATDPAGKALRGAMDASTPQEVKSRLEGRGFSAVAVLTETVINPPITGGKGAVSGQGANLGAGGQVRVGAISGNVPAASPQALGLFFRQMASLAEAGFTPAAALGNLAPRTADPALSAAAQRMALATGKGASLAGELSRENGLFPEHIVGLVAAGEAGGFLPFVYDEAALGAEQDEALRKGMWWVKALIWQSVWSVILFAPVFPSIDFNAFGKTVVNYFRALLLLGVPIGLGLHAACWFGGRWWATPAASATRDRLSLKIPVMARLARVRALASFTRVLRKLLSAGVAPETAYRAAARSVPNSVLREKFESGAGVLRSGLGLDAAIEASGVMDHDPLQLLVTGQQTGKWLETLDQITAFYQEEVARATEAAKSAQKRVGVIVTLVSTGYVMIAATHGLASLGFRFTEGMEGQ